MGPLRKSRSVNRRYINEVSPSKDGDSAQRSNSKKRKLSDMLGPRWATEELTCFYDAYRKYGKDWKKVAGAVRNRSSEMVEAIYTMNRAYLSLPHGTASATGLIAMVTDHYSNLAGSESDQEGMYGVGTSKKSQKRVRGKARPMTSKAPDDQFVSHSQTIASDYVFLSLTKKKRSGGNRHCPVGKRTPRFPVSVSYENVDGDKFVSPTRQGLKIKAYANDDEVAHEIAIALAEASHIGGSPQVSRTPNKRPVSVMPSPSRRVQQKHSLRDMADTKILATDMDKELEASTESDKGELSMYVHSSRKEARKLEDKRFEVDSNSEDNLEDSVEEYNGTEEDKISGVTGDKKVLFRKDDTPAFDALQTLADLSLMMPTENEDDSEVQLKDEEVSSEVMHMNQPKEKGRYSGVKMKGHPALSRSEIASNKKSRTGKTSVLNVSAVPEENQDSHRSIPKTSRRKQKLQMPKSESQPDVCLSESPGIGSGDAGKMLISSNNKSSQSASTNLVKTAETYSVADLREEGSDPAQSDVHVLVADQVNLPKVRSRRKMHLRKPEFLKDLKFPDKISTELPLASIHDGESSFKEKLSSCLENPHLRRWCTYEWFYSAIDYPWFAKREFVEYLYHVGLGHMPRLTRVEWGVIRSSLGKPRRFSEQFLREEKQKLNQYRFSVRKHYSELRDGVREGLPTDLARPLSVGQRVIAIHPKTRELHDGSVLTVDHSRCRVQFHRRELGVEFVMDIDCMPLNPYENMPALLGRQSIAVDNFFENLSGMEVNERPPEFMKLGPGDNVVNNNVISQLGPAGFLKHTKVASANANSQSKNVSETSSYQQTSYFQIHAKEADVRALTELTRALDRKDAVVMELRHLNDDVFENQKNGDSSLKESEPFKKHYAAVLIQLNEANDQVSSALYCLRQRNTYQGSIPLALPKPGSYSAYPGDGFPLDRASCQTHEQAWHMNEIIDRSTIKARAMVAAAVQAISSFNGKDDTTEKIEEAIDHVNDRLRLDDSGTPIPQDLKQEDSSSLNAQIPSELISKCVATLLMIQKCTERQFPPSDVAQILDSSVASLKPRSSKNLPVYTEIQTKAEVSQEQADGRTEDQNLDAQAQADANEGATATGEENLDVQADGNEEILGGENLQPTENVNIDDQEDSMLTTFDPKTWENLDNSKRDILIEKGPVREMNLQFPSDPSNRRFSYAYYSRKLNNGEVVDRKWLVYSKHVDRVYCFCCKLFNSNQNKALLASAGVRDWKHLSDKLKQHENSQEHLKNMNTWNDLRIRLSKNQTIDAEMQREIVKEKERWRQVLKILTDNVERFTVKPLSDTRWENRTKSVQPIRYQAPQIRSALKEVERTSSDDPKAVSEAESLVTAIENFEFLVGMVIWDDILSTINMVSKKLQSPIVCLDATLKQIQGVTSYFQKYRDTGFSASIETAKSIASSMNVDPTFPTKRQGKRKKHFDEENDETEELQFSAIESFKFEYFLVIVDHAIASLTSRFDQLKKFEEIFGFLFNSENLKSLDNSDLHKCCTIFLNKFSHDSKSDVELDDLFAELKVLQVTLPDELMSASQILHFVKVADCYPNVSIVYRILLTIPVTVVSAERSFSKLKLLKNCLRSTMLQERLNGLAMCSIEKDILDKIDLDVVLEDFASRNARRQFFKKN
ncbi:Protein ALWAYS EARLY 3 [Striga hermonthica]|uniref:Protein ALWAYS EARLY 3 n=1 Tax=Striga hermonthica TaxID=68872 RepID=A0A9N7NPH5_STRHE|nr:Protein ALWAYS EARLY 3 [Striga hermonthica]